MVEGKVQVSLVEVLNLHASHPGEGSFSSPRFIINMLFGRMRVNHIKLPPVDNGKSAVF